MLHEISITPDVFLPQGYNPPQLCEACTEGLHMALLEWCLIRDLRAGGWKQLLRDRMNEMPFRTRALWKNLMRSGRLQSFASALPANPTDDLEWCAEALECHKGVPCMGILASATTKRSFQQDSIVASIENRSSATWWQNLEVGHPDGPTTQRKLADYQSRLLPLLRAARSLMFIDPHLDPHLDPTKPHYANFIEMIRPALNRSAPKPKIEVHRCCTDGSGKDARVIDGTEWERRFKERWQTTLNSTGSQVEVFIWSDFHDRHLITDLLGIHLGNGFDTSNDVNKRVTWSRLASKDRDEVQRLFDRSANGSKLIHRFTVQ